MFRVAQVLQPVRAEVAQLCDLAERATHHTAAASKKDLTAVGHGSQPGGAVESEADQARWRLGGFPGMDAHPHPELPAVGHVGEQGPCISTSGARAAEGEENTAKSRPLRAHSLPPWAASADRTMHGARREPRCIASAKRLSSPVEPSISVNRNANIPTATA